MSEHVHEWRHIGARAYYCHGCGAYKIEQQRPVAVPPAPREGER